MNEEQMILDNIPLIYKSIQNLHLNWKTQDEFQDYYDAGLIGLINGVRTFKEEKGVKISTFLVPCIENEIKRYIVHRISKKRFNEHGKDFSLNATMNEETGTELIEFITDKRINIEEEVERKIQFEEIIHKINSMKLIKDALVIKMYYGLEGFTPRTLKEIGDILGITKVRVRARLNRGLKLLKEEMRNKNEKENN